MTKKPTAAKLLEHLRHAIAWSPTRLVDRVILKQMKIEEDVQEMLGHLGMESFYTMAYPTYKEVSCQFLASLEATFYTSLHEEQGWGMIKFKIDGRVHSMSFQEIGDVLGLKDSKNPSMPKLKAPSLLQELGLDKQGWRCSDWIGGLITPLLAHKGISLGNYGDGPLFLDANYLKKVGYFSGTFNGSCVYSYLRGDNLAEVVLPMWDITNLKVQGEIRFDIQ
ncbi:hypothetical protein Rs2_41041 [Raphanus sativus]|nr:hypothetical protein Rs2_41041 [Raphanus sativus]